MEDFSNLRYEPDTGLFFWVSHRRKPLIGRVAGCVTKNGYRKICYKGKAYLAHRLAWFFTNGIWPKEDIDHIDGNRLNNRISNLRDVSRSVNMQNLKHHISTNRVGLLGVCWLENRKRYIAQIRVGNKIKYIGMYKNAQEAHEAYLQAKRKYHAGCTI